jgi:mono/diheme cytochrome c family protein
MPWIGNPLLIALDAVLHVLVSHGIAIGGMSIIVMSEYLGWRRYDAEWESLARKMIKPALIIAVAVGAPTGAGIWFITSVIAPRAIGSLLRVFFWPWFVEWIFFVSEVCLALAYYYTWDRWGGAQKQKHLRLGFLLMFASVGTAALITGILGFMLTPDGWPWTRSFWHAFFNPTYVPQLVLRLGEAAFLGSTFAIFFLVFTRQEAGFRRRALRVFGSAALAGVAAVVLGGLWYFRQVPLAFKSFVITSWGIQIFSQRPMFFWTVLAVAALAVALFAIAAASGLVGTVRAGMAVTVIAALLLVGGFEFVRESIRKPYLMPGYMYSNQILMDEAPYLEAHGLLANSYWYNATHATRSVRAEGAYLFQQNCSRCHSVNGFNSILERTDGRTEDGLYVIIRDAHQIVPFMPPFAGSDQERRILASFLFELSTGKIPPGAVAELAAGAPLGPPTSPVVARWGDREVKP